MHGSRTRSRRHPKPQKDYCKNPDLRLVLFDEIRDNTGAMGANGASTPPPPNQDGGASSTMITSDYSTPTTPSQSQTRRTYPQNWPAYNGAQTHEQEQFTKLLRELCDTVPQPPQTFGRPRLPLSDVLFGIGLKVYSTMSGRRAMTDFRDAQAKGLLDKVPSFTSTFRYLENPDLAPLLKDLIERSALPLRSVETDFAVDSSGFSTSVYKRWFDYKWGKTRKKG